MIDLPKEQSRCYCCEVINGHTPDCPYFILQDLISKHNKDNGEKATVTMKESRKNDK